MPATQRAGPQARPYADRFHERDGAGSPALFRQRLNQYGTFTRNRSLARVSKRSPRFSWKSRFPSAPRERPRPWFQTRKSVLPGRYSHRKTALELKAMKLKPPGAVVTTV